MTQEDQGSSPPQSGPKGRGHFPAPVIAIAALVAAFAFLYATKAWHRNEETAAAPSCAYSRLIADRLKPLVHGEIAALSVASAPTPMPQLVFDGPDGKPLKLSDFHGRNILINLWASWCVPCRREMPALDRLEGKKGSDSFQVVAIDIDTARLDRSKAFLQQIGVKNLAFYSDPKADVFETLKEDGKALGLPTSFLIGKDGCVIGTMAGPAEWDSADAVALIDAAEHG